MRSRVFRKVSTNSSEANTLHVSMVSCQPSLSLPPPSQCTSAGVAAVTTVPPAKAKMKRRPLTVERSCGSADSTPDSALYGMLMQV